MLVSYTHLGGNTALVVAGEAPGVGGHPKVGWRVQLLLIISTPSFLIPRRTLFVQRSALHAAHALQGSRPDGSFREGSAETLPVMVTPSPLPPPRVLVIGEPES